MKQTYCVLLVTQKGFEPSLQNRKGILIPSRLPIPPLSRNKKGLQGIGSRLMVDGWVINGVISQELVWIMHIKNPGKRW